MDPFDNWHAWQVNRDHMIELWISNKIDPIDSY